MAAGFGKQLFGSKNAKPAIAASNSHLQKLQKWAGNMEKFPSPSRKEQYRLFLKVKPEAGGLWRTGQAKRSPCYTENSPDSSSEALLRRARS